MSEHREPIPSMIYNAAVGGHVTSSQQIIDENENKEQSQINAEVKQTLGQGGSVDSRIAAAVNIEKTRAEGAEADRYTKSETYTKEEVHNLITTPNQEYVSVTATSQTTAVTDVLPATGAADTTYRVGNWDGTQYNDSVFSEYAWNGSAYIKLSTKSQVGEVCDISANHADTKYADLAAALGTNGANIPQSLRKGGMSVKFVQSSDNKYVQYRLMSNTFNTTPANWQGVDDEPTAGSNNLVESGGVDLRLLDSIITLTQETDIRFIQRYLNFEAGHRYVLAYCDIVPGMELNISIQTNSGTIGGYNIGFLRQNDTWNDSADNPTHLIVPDAHYKGLSIYIWNGGTVTGDCDILLTIKNKILDDSIQELNSAISDVNNSCEESISSLASYEKSTLVDNTQYGNTILLDGEYNYSPASRLTIIENNELPIGSLLKLQVSEKTGTLAGYELYAVRYDDTTTRLGNDNPTSQTIQAHYKRLYIRFFESGTTSGIAYVNVSLPNKFIFHTNQYKVALPKWFGVEPFVNYNGQEVYTNSMNDNRTGFNDWYQMFHSLAANSELQEINIGDNYNSAMSETTPQYISGIQNGGIYMYHLSPMTDDESNFNQKHKVLKVVLCGGVHGSERKSIWDLYKLLKNLIAVTTQTTNVLPAKSVLSLRYFVDLYVIPMINVSGIEACVRNNANGINLNRDFYVDNWEEVSDSGATYNSQWETRVVSWQLEQLNANVLIDHHTSSGDNSKSSLNPDGDEPGKFTMWGGSDIEAINSLMEEKIMELTPYIRAAFPDKFEDYDFVYGHTEDQTGQEHYGTLDRHFTQLYGNGLTWEAVQHLRWTPVGTDRIFGFSDTDEIELASINYFNFVNLLMQLLDYTKETINNNNFRT